MGFFDWFSRKSAGHSAEQASSFHGTSTFDASRLTPYPGVLVRPGGPDTGPDSETGRKIREASAQAKARAVQRNEQRNTYRDLLHQIVREAMVKAHLLSASYKFKVLSLDSRGRSFLVMMDLPLEFTKNVKLLGDTEQSIIQTARNRHQLEVTAVYWRVADLTTTAASAATTAAEAAAAPAKTSVAAALQPAPAATTPAAAVAPRAAPTAVAPAKPIPSVASPEPARAAPVLADEVAALKAALAAGAASAAVASAASAKFGAVTAAMEAVKPKTAAPSSDKNLLLTGFEETEMADDDSYPVLGSSQYGELR